MRRWSIIPWLIVGIGLTVPAGAHGMERPLASHFDLSGYMVRSVSDGMNPEARGDDDKGWPPAPLDAAGHRRRSARLHAA